MSPPIWRRYSTTQAPIKMKPSNAQCSSCKTNLNQVKIPQRAREHVIERHYPFTLHEEIDQERSLFFENAISPQSLFHAVIIELRSGLQPSKKQGHRYIYYYTFDFQVGVFPNRQGGFCKTYTIKIVCNYTKCRKCNHHWPSAVVTIYPCKECEIDCYKCRDV